MTPNPQDSAVALEVEREAPPNNLPDWSECAMRVANSDFIAKRVAEGGHGPEADSKLATELHRFIYEYDDADRFRSAWFLHRLELLLNETRRASQSDGTSGGWISVDERLPPPITTVIAHGRQYGDHGRHPKVYTTYTGTRVRETVEDEEITHWMPLPAAPNQGENHVG